MDYSKPTLIVISGPNGAGKSTHIQSMLPPEFASVRSFDRDKTRTEIEHQLFDNNEITRANIQREAMRMMEDLLVSEMKNAIRLRLNFVLETPLSHPDYWRYIDLFENNGYQIQLNYLCLDKVGDCIARVEQRVLEGGHYVEPKTIKGVYEKNLYHINEFRKTFKVIELYDGMKLPTLLAKIEAERVVMAIPMAMKKSWIKTGLPSISAKLSIFINTNK